MLTLFQRDRKYLLCKNLNMVFFIYIVFNSHIKNKEKLLFYTSNPLTRKNEVEIIKSNNHILLRKVIPNTFYCYFVSSDKVNLFVIMFMLYFDKKSTELKKQIFDIIEEDDKN